MLLNEVSTEEIEIHAIDTIPTSCNLPECLITAAQNKHSDTSGPAKTLKLKVGAKVMLTANIVIKDCLINGQMQIIKHFEIIWKCSFNSLHRI